MTPFHPLRGFSSIRRTIILLLLSTGVLVTSSASSTASSSASSFWRYTSTVPTPLAFWTFQEPTGTPRQPTGLYPTYRLIDGNSSAPIEQTTDGVFGPFSAYFPATDGINSNNTQRLFIARTAAPALTSAITGPNATVTMIAWIKRTQTNSSEGMIAGVWDEYLRARQYAIFTDLGACYTNCPNYKGGLAAHISNCGGPTPGRPYSYTAACDNRTLPVDEWHCLTNVYNGTHILAYLNGTLLVNGNTNPFYYPGGIYSPESNHAPGAEFGVGANVVNKTVNAPPVASNRFQGKLGGLVMFQEALEAHDVAAVCGEADGFEDLRRSL